MRIHDPIEKMKCEHCDFTTRSNKVFQYHLYQQHGIQYNAFSSPLSIKVGRTTDVLFLHNIQGSHQDFKRWGPGTQQFLEKGSCLEICLF